VIENFATACPRRENPTACLMRRHLSSASSGDRTQSCLNCYRDRRPFGIGAFNHSAATSANRSCRDSRHMDCLSRLRLKPKVTLGASSRRSTDRSDVFRSTLIPAFSPSERGEGGDPPPFKRRVTVWCRTAHGEKNSLSLSQRERSGMGSASSSTGAKRRQHRNQRHEDT